ncbi:TIGR04282 family arsenosugar biosynthesis glycosyltransferase [Geobacter sp.]|uniref:TIGR04282 family arsenosugar biosynthesis glycosyltransferase n=1 Tax=Geobacter sp. TaxID=46610 RepID=UPI00262CDE71|nr:TIGR04282 family arsenosugar biosynthesis glycosyltransferase [Geobacter sp.]
MSKTLLIFAKKPTPGRVKTRLVPPLSADAAAELYRCMLFDVLGKVGQMTGVDRQLCYEEGEGARGYFEGVFSGELFPQEGHDLGERMAGAFRRAFDRGDGRVAIIGTDSPDLPPEFVGLAYALLADPAVDAVFGPSEDGGYYLLAMKRFHPELFAHIPWSTEHVLECSLARAAEAGLATALLPPWYDVDTADDLRRPGLVAPESTAPLTREFLLGLARLTSPHSPHTPAPGGR